MTRNPQTDSSVIYQFGEFRLIPLERVLQRNETLIALSPKVFDVLVMLVENHGHLIEKEELLDTIWKDAFVEEATLSRTISRLRKSLGKENKYIETIAKSGYRFIEPVERIEDVDISISQTNVKTDSSEQLNDNISTSEARDPNQQNWLLKPRISLLIGLILISMIATAFIWRSKIFDRKDVTSIKSIAVLPFKNLGKGENENALELAMADALITKLNSIETLVVLPTSAIYKYSEKENLVPIEIGENLKVDAILDGTIQRIGERLRVNIQLINVADGTPLWTEKFDSEDKDIFALQDNISQQVTNALELTLSGQQKKNLTKRYTENREAYEAYIKGRYLWNRRNPDDFKRSMELFQKAIEIDPNYALPYTGIADNYQLFAEYRMMPIAEGFAKARSAARKALEIDDSLAEAHASLGYTLAFYDWNFDAAENSFKKAIELNPNYATAYQWYAEYLIAMGRFEEAKTIINKAVELDPLSPIINTLTVGYLFTVEKYDEAIKEAKKVTDINPDFALVYGFQALCYFENGMREEGIDSWVKATELNGTRTEAERAKLIKTWKNDGWESFWQVWLRQIESNPKFHLAWDRAFVYLIINQEEQAIEWFEKSFDNRERWIINIKYASIYKDIRKNPRIQKIIKNIGIK